MNAQQKKLLLPIAILALGLVSLIGAAFFILRDTGSKSPAAAVGGPFSMIDHHGARVSEASYRGGPMIVFFGFTHCPDVCPTTLFEMSEVLRQIPKERKVAALFVTVDPERDTPEKLKDYLSSFDSRIFGLTGPRADVDAMLKTFRVYARKVPQEGSDYTMDHTAIVYLMDKQGRFVNALNMQQPPAQISREIQRFF
jgi:protein SCO1/2